ncbi:MAG TPA: Rab family GTPase [Burkholderiales bacterium]|nr:Rab family GTPase [Burkholderiales bacterium]
MALQKKICMLGAFAVGKTSLVRRYVDSIFSDRYLTTVGVKIDKRMVTVSAAEVSLILWDIAGEDEISQVRTSYVRGAAGYLLVADGTRPATIDVAQSIQQRMEAEVGKLPFVVLLNKRDLQSLWSVSAEDIAALQRAGWTVRMTSAHSGEGVEQAFQTLAERVTSHP